MSKWIAIATRRNVLKRCLKVSVIVGTILVAVNQGDAILGGASGSQLYWKIPLTYIVPFMVSTYATVSAIIDNETT